MTARSTSTSGSAGCTSSSRHSVRARTVSSTRLLIRTQARPSSVGTDFQRIDRLSPQSGRKHRSQHVGNRRGVVFRYPLGEPKLVRRHDRNRVEQLPRCPARAADRRYRQRAYDPLQVAAGERDAHQRTGPTSRRECFGQAVGKQPSRSTEMGENRYLRVASRKTGIHSVTLVAGAGQARSPMPLRRAQIDRSGSSVGSPQNALAAPTKS